MVENYNTMNFIAAASTMQYISLWNHTNHRSHALHAYWVDCRVTDVRVKALSPHVTPAAPQKLYQARPAQIYIWLELNNIAVSYSTRKPTGCPQVPLRILQILDQDNWGWAHGVHGFIVNSFGFTAVYVFTHCNLKFWITTFTYEHFCLWVYYITSISAFWA